MDRTAQRQAFQNAIQPFFDAQDESDAAAAQAGASADAIAKAQQDYDRAVQNQRDRKPGANTAVDKAQAVLDGLKNSTQTAQDVYVNSQNAFVTLTNALQQLDTNPGAVEQVTQQTTTY